jgi:hypothetical protein
MRGYIDTGCSIVTLRQVVAEELQLKLQPTIQYIRGYAGGATRASGVTDLVTGDVTVFVVADEVQSV